MADKVYLLDAPKLRDDKNAKSNGTAAPAPAPQTPRIPNLDELPEAWVKPQTSAGRRPFRGVFTLLAAYALGGVAPLALRVGPRKFAWASLTVLSLAGWSALAWYWHPVRAMMVSGRLPILPVLVGLLLVHAVGAIAWSRALVHIVRDDRFQPQSLPQCVRHPWTAAVAGLVAPGAGLAIAGHAFRSALALWNAACVALAALVLSQANLLWSWNAKNGADGMPKTFVEGLFMAAAAVVVLGGLFWVGAALDGARHVEQQRRRTPANTNMLRADAAAVGLVAVLATLALTFRPGSTALDLDRFANSMRFSGYRMIPLALETTAAALDPGRPEYAMHVAQLDADMGRADAARTIHDRLRERWEVYAQMLLQTAANGTTAPSRPIQPARDLMSRTPDLARGLAGPPKSPAQ